MISDRLKKKLEEQQYRMAGRHSAVKICSWTKKSLIDDGVCYKQKFYGIRSHLCCQTTTCMSCANFCVFCWRDMSAPALHEFPKDIEPSDPAQLIGQFIESQKKLLIGFRGNDKVNWDKLKQSDDPQHFAFSLTGEPLLYPRLQELMDLLHAQGKTTFVVASGQFPEHLRKLRPTQLYISVDAPNKELFDKIDRSTFDDGWQRLLQSLDILKEIKNETRTSLRITCIKGMNMEDAEGYAKLIERSDPMFVEVKAYMFVGSSRQRLDKENMPYHSEVKEFAQEIADKCGYKIIDEQERSRVVLLMKEDFDGRIMKFD